MNRLKKEKQIAVVSMLVEGNSIRSIERITGVHRDTIMRLMLHVGRHCADVMDQAMRGLRFQAIQIDELWCYVAKKQARVQADDPAE